VSVGVGVVGTRGSVWYVYGVCVVCGYSGGGGAGWTHTYRMRQWQKGIDMSTWKGGGVYIVVRVHPRQVCVSECQCVGVGWKQCRMRE